MIPLVQSNAPIHVQLAMPLIHVQLAMPPTHVQLAIPPIHVQLYFNYKFKHNSITEIFYLFVLSLSKYLLQICVGSSFAIKEDRGLPSQW